MQIDWLHRGSAQICEERWICSYGALALLDYDKEEDLLILVEERFRGRYDMEIFVGACFEPKEEARYKAVTLFDENWKIHWY